MDEGPNDIDRVFKQTAERAAGLAHVLDPEKAIERGANRLRFARRRKIALSGVVVIAAVVVFLVPLPQLHLFGHGATTTSLATGVGPPGGVVATGFEARSFSAIGPDDWWLLGSARCPTASGSCAAIVRTTDGGLTFAGIPGPPVAATDVTQLLFADDLDGYAFGPELWETTDGGTTWSRVGVTGSVAELETADGESYALTCRKGSMNCQSMELFRSRVGSGRWQLVSTPVALGYGARLAVAGMGLYLLSGNEPPLALLYSSDRGATFTKRVDPCSPTLGGSLDAAVDGSGALWAACTSGSAAATLRSDNGGTAWTTEQGGFPNSVQVAAASQSVALASPGQEQGRPALLERTTNGGRSFSVVLSLSGARVVWLGFTSPARAYILVTRGAATKLFESGDGGAGWHSVVIKR